MEMSRIISLSGSMCGFRRGYKRILCRFHRAMEGIPPCGWRGSTLPRVRRCRRVTADDSIERWRAFPPCGVHCEMENGSALRAEGLGSGAKPGLAGGKRVESPTLFPPAPPISRRRSSAAAAPAGTPVKTCNAIKRLLMILVLRLETGILPVSARATSCRAHFAGLCDSLVLCPCKSRVMVSGVEP